MNNLKLVLLIFSFGVFQSFAQSTSNFEFTSIKAALKNPIEVKILDLSGQNLTKLPESILKLSNLEELNISENPDLHFEEMFELLAKLENLKFINLQNSELQMLPNNFSNLKKLEILWLDENLFEVFPEPLKKMNHLKELKLFGNKITEVYFEPGDLQSLEIIDLCYNEFTRFPVELSVLPNLKQIIIWYNFISLIPNEIGNFKEIEEIHLEHNKISAIPTQFSELKSLKTLSLRDNLLRSENIFPIYRLSGLVNLDLQGNQIVTLSKEINNWRKMRRFSICDNPILELPFEFQELNEMEQLGLGDLHKINWESTFSIIGKLPNLKKIGMYGMNLERMPNGFEKLQQVETFWMRFNLFDENEKERIRKLIPTAKIDFGN